MLKSSLYLVITLVLLVQHVTCLYDSKSNVIDLTDKNFNTEVIKSNSLYFVEFYAPWCGHCKALAPEYNKVADTLAGIVKVGAVDMDKYQSLGQPYGITGFPTLKLFVPNSKKPIDYNGARDSKAMIDFVLQNIKSTVDKRLTGKTDTKQKKSKSTKSDSSNVVQLTSDTFVNTVYNSDDTYLVEFYAPWCGHCKALAPEWENAATQLVGTNVKLAAVDATVHTDLASRYDIKGYPTIKIFKPNSNGKAEDYNGGRTANDIVTFAKNIAAATAKPRDVHQLINSEIFTTECSASSICLIAFLPNILDTTAKERKQQIDLLKQLAEKYKSRSFSYLWVEGLSQPELESTFGITAGNYPALTAVNIKKQRSSVHLGAYTPESINDFTKRLLNGKADQTIEYTTEPNIVETSKWNGKDAEKPIVADEYDIDISDIIGTSRTDEL